MCSAYIYRHHYFNCREAAFDLLKVSERSEFYCPVNLTYKNVPIGEKRDCLCGVSMDQLALVCGWFPWQAVMDIVLGDYRILPKNERPAQRIADKYWLKD